MSCKIHDVNSKILWMKHTYVLCKKLVCRRKKRCQEFFELSIAGIMEIFYHVMETSKAFEKPIS